MSDVSSTSTGPLAAHLSARIEQRLQKLSTSVKASYTERSIDTVHQLRVASRRLRAFALVFKDVLGEKAQARLEKELKRVTNAVGALRDLDVLVGFVEGRLARAGAELERAAIEHLLEHLEQRRVEAGDAAEARLKKLDTGELARRVRRAARDVIAGLSPADAQRAYARTLLQRLILDAVQQELPASGAEQAAQLHRLRIDIKELRYALELFEPVLGEHFTVLYERATALQELLGTHHDLTVLGEIVAERAADLARKHRHTLSAGLHLAGAALAADQQTILARFQKRGFDGDWWRDELRRALEPS